MFDLSVLETCGTMTTILLWRRHSRIEAGQFQVMLYLAREIRQDYINHDLRHSRCENLKILQSWNHTVWGKFSVSFCMVKCVATFHRNIRIISNEMTRRLLIHIISFVSFTWAGQYVDASQSDGTTGRSDECGYSWASFSLKETVRIVETVLPHFIARTYLACTPRNLPATTNYSSFCDSACEDPCILCADFRTAE